jgi:hypothetical protein
VVVVTMPSKRVSGSTAFTSFLHDTKRENAVKKQSHLMERIWIGLVKL